MRSQRVRTRLNLAGGGPEESGIIRSRVPQEGKESQKSKGKSQKSKVGKWWIMRLLLGFGISCALACGAMLDVRESGFTAGADGRPAGWTTWSARAENAPRTFV